MENIHQGHREKMRQRFLKSGLESFADHEALELLLYYAIPRRDTNPIAHRLMERYGSLTAVILLILWLYVIINLLFIGAGLNAELLPKGFSPGGEAVRKADG